MKYKKKLKIDVSIEADTPFVRETTASFLKGVFGGVALHHSQYKSHKFEYTITEE